MHSLLLQVLFLGRHGARSSGCQQQKHVQANAQAAWRELACSRVRAWACVGGEAGIGVFACGQVDEGVVSLAEMLACGVQGEDRPGGGGNMRANRRGACSQKVIDVLCVWDRRVGAYGTDGRDGV